MGWKGVNPPHTGSHLRGWISVLVRVRGQAVLGSHLSPILGPQRRTCPSRGEMGVRSRLGAQNAWTPRVLRLYPWAGVDFSIGLLPSWSSRAKPCAHGDACPRRHSPVRRFPAANSPLPRPHPCAAPSAAGKLPVPNPGKFRGYFALGRDCLRQVHGLRGALMPGVFSVNREGK